MRIFLPQILKLEGRRDEENAIENDEENKA
jgi:hypothetical protein